MFLLVSFSNAQWVPNREYDKILEYSLDYNTTIDSLELSVKIQARSTPMWRDFLNYDKLPDVHKFEAYYCRGAGGGFSRYYDTLKMK